MPTLKSIIAQVLDIPETSITDQTSPDNVANWDSFNGLMLVSALEKAYQVKFTIGEVTSVRTVADIKAALQKHGVAVLE